MRTPDPATRRLLEAMPKAELHLHLDGSLRVGTALDLARTRGIDAPTSWQGTFDAPVAPMPCRDQAGQEAAFPDPMTHGRAFEAARAGGLRITVHAGEWGGAAQVRRALQVNPERIAHGEATSQDPALIAELRARGVCLDLCPTSNVQAGIVPSLAEHGIARLHRAGTPVTLSTDDTTISDISLTDEYGRAIAE